MKIKKFTARNHRLALEMIKKEFGDDAVILSTAEKKGSSPLVEITAAIDYDSGLYKENNTPKGEASFPNENFTASHIASLYKNNDKKAGLNYTDSDSDKMNVENVQISLGNTYSLSSNRKKGLFDYPDNNSIKEEHAANQHSKFQSLNDNSLSVKNLTGKKDAVKSSKVIMLIGPTGVGKTTTVAKLSAKALKEGKKVGIISLDTYRIGAVEQIRIYARIMGVQLFTASSPEALRDGIPRFLKGRDVIFIDTMGRNPRDEAYIKFLAESCLLDIPMDIHLLVSANSDSNFLLETYKFYNALPISYIAFTKIDEAVRFDNLHNLLMVYRKPVAYLTTGQKVPDDIEFPLSDDISDLLLNKRMRTC